MLVTMKEILDRASKENYGVAAPNIFNTLDARAYIEAAEEMNAPLILDIASMIEDKYHLGVAAKSLAEDAKVPVAINLDHGDSMENVYRSIQAGFTSVMFDRSTLPFDEHVKQVAECVKVAHTCGLSVEAELGHVGQTDDYEGSMKFKTDPSEAKEFIEKTGVDCLAVAIGTAHGIYPKGVTPTIDIELLKEIKKVTNGFPLVLHGSSGTKDEDLEAAGKNGINKYNICGELLSDAAQAIQAADLSGGKAYGVWDVAANALKEALKGKMKLYGCVGKAWIPAKKGISAKADAAFKKDMI